MSLRAQDRSRGVAEDTESRSAGHHFGDVGRRINVIGCSGSGKSTLAKALAAKLQLKCIELDSFQHRENWRQASREEFLDYVHDAVEAERWVIDGNYSMIRPTVWPRVDTIIWLDYPMTICLWRMWKRTVRRWARREILWNGNREHLWWHFFSKKSLILWVITSHSRKREEFIRLFASPELASKNLIRLTSPAETAAWLASLDSTTSHAREREVVTIET